MAEVLTAAANDSGRVTVADVVLDGMPVRDYRMTELREDSMRVAEDIAQRHPDRT